MVPLTKYSGTISTRPPIEIAISVSTIISSRFSVRVLSETEFGPFPAVIPEVEGSASITGRHEFVIDPDDPLARQRMKVDNDDVTPMASLQYTFDEWGFVNGGSAYKDGESATCLRSSRRRGPIAVRGPSARSAR